MHDLRRQALESKKTISRKAQSREVSRATSRANSGPNSRQESRNASRQPSDEEELGNQSDDTAWSVASTDDLFSSSNDDYSTAESRQAELKDRIDELLDRKRSSIQSREEALTAYVRILTSHHTPDGIEGRTSELLAAFSKSIKAESSEKETILALKAVAVTAVTLLDDTIYETMSPLLRRSIADSTLFAVKAAAIHCLGTCTFFGGADDEGILEQMGFLMEIISSDGTFVNAGDNGPTVTAALEEWGFLATELQDLADESEEAIETFVEQLESSESTVQIAAGENIALLYEKSYSPQEEGELLTEEEDDNSSVDGGSSPTSDDEEESGARLVKRYNAYHNTPQIITLIDALAHVSGRHINKKSKRSLHMNFASILTTIENPRRGPQYNKAIDHETDRHYGSRKTVKIHQDSFMRLNRWWKWLRLAALRRLLQGGFVAHYLEGNHAVLESLPVTARQASVASSRTKSAGLDKISKKGGRRKATEIS